MNRTMLMFRGSAVAAVALAAAACNRDLPVSHPRLAPELAIGYELSSLTAHPGDRVTLAIKAEPATGEVLGGLQGYVRFDPARLRLVGQTPSGRTLAIANYDRADAGELRVASLNPAGLDARTAVFTFEVRSPDYAQALDYRLEMAVTLSGQEFTHAAAPTLNAAADLVAGEPHRYTLADWDALLWPNVAPMHSVPGQYRLNLQYGDATLDGNVLINDASYVANVSVGNSQLITGTDTPARDGVVAGNVRPSNNPGLGEPADAVPPGQDASGTRTILINDALAIAQEAVGIAQDIVGELIPGRGPVSTNRIIVTGSITTATTWSANNIYQLDGLVRVNGGGVLTIEAGTRIEGNTAVNPSALFVERDGQIFAVGTALQPVVFSCTQAVPKTAGCWGGIFIAGNAHINHNTGQPNSPIIAGRAATGGCLSTQGEGNAPFFGGCNDDDNSGTLKYVVIEYAGFLVGPNNELNGLSLGGVGRGTTIDFIQAHRGLDDGIEYFGGTVNSRHLVLTANSDDAFDLSFGWIGHTQFVIVQQYTLDGDKGIEADNNEPAGFEDTPLTTPQVWNFTLIGEPDPTSTLGTTGNNVNDAIHARRGTAFQLNNALVMNFLAGLDIDDAATCTTPEPNISTSLFAGLVATGNADTGDPVCSGGATEAAYLAVTAKNNQIVASSTGILTDAFGALAPDFRPMVTLPAGVSISGATPPATPAGFYDQTATYIGAVPQVSGTGGGNIPWYSGWTRGWQNATTP